MGAACWILSIRSTSAEVRLVVHGPVRCRWRLLRLPPRPMHLVPAAPPSAVSASRVTATSTAISLPRAHPPLLSHSGTTRPGQALPPGAVRPALGARRRRNTYAGQLGPGGQSRTKLQFTKASRGTNPKGREANGRENPLLPRRHSLSRDLKRRRGGRRGGARSGDPSPPAALDGESWCPAIPLPSTCSDFFFSFRMNATRHPAGPINSGSSSPTHRCFLLLSFLSFSSLIKAVAALFGFSSSSS